MTSKDNLDEQLHELSQSIVPDEKLGEHVMSRIDATSATGKAGTGHIGKIIMKHSLVKLVAAAVIAVVVWASIDYFRGSAKGTSKVYAAMIEALHNVHTVHVSGWTTKIQSHHTTIGDTSHDTSKRYPIEIWEWFTEDGAHRMYEKQGPITLWHDGDRRYEYQADKDTLYIDKSQLPSLLSDRFQSFAREIEPFITRHGDKMIFRADRVSFLDDSVIDGRKAQGFRLDRDDQRKEIWFDNETKHMLEINSYVFDDGQWKQWRHGVCAYDQEVPANIRSYTPPDTEHVEYSSDIDPRFERYHKRLREIAAYYQQHPLPETMELLPRASDERIDAYSPGRLSGITDTTGYWVLPIQSSLADFLRTKIRPYGSLRVSEDLQSIQLNGDLITKNDHTSRERADFVLDALGLEIVEVSEPHKMWIARYDGRPLKPWQEVKAPVARGNARHTEPGMDWSSNPHTMKDLFEGLAYYQNYDLNAKGIIIINDTGLPSEPIEGQSDETVAVSSASPYWRGDEIIEMAREWFEEQFGVTFTEETRPMTIHVVRRRGHEQEELKN
jgi:hypothetical protein